MVEAPILANNNNHMFDRAGRFGTAIPIMIVLLRNEASRYSIAIRSELADDLPKVMADRVQLQQVLMNLMLNGIEAMKDLGPQGTLTISSRRESGHMVISVSDTGVGLTPEQSGQIFDAFFTTKPQGTGMGLTISRSIVESHGGRLSVTSSRLTPGKSGCRKRSPNECCIRFDPLERRSKSSIERAQSTLLSFTPR
jgi:signal transduction histidine kinase